MSIRRAEDLGIVIKIRARIMLWKEIEIDTNIFIIESCIEDDGMNL